LPDWAGQRTGAQLAADWYFGGLGPPAPVEIPYTWLSALTWRVDLPYTSASVAGPSGTDRRYDPDARARYGDRAYSATLSTATDADPANLAAWVMSYLADPGDTPRQRMVLRLRLGSRTQTECWRVLDVGEGRRISITGAPSTWPAGATEQIVEGRGHLVDADEHTVQWITSPVIGSSPGTAGPWFRLDNSQLDGDDALPF
jgi:hypothetical protein